MTALLTVIGGGGFTFETKCLLQSLADDTRIVYLIPPLAGVPGVNGLPAGEHHVVPMFATVTENSKIQSAKAFVATFFKALTVLHATRFDAVVAIGCSHVVPLFMAARLAGRQTIFIESITRADKLSITGRIVYALHLANTFIVQWPELVTRFPRAVLGNIL